MADDKRNLPTRYYDNGAPAPRSASASDRPAASLPSLPSSSGAFIGTPRWIAKKDTAFVDQHAEFLRARSRQAYAFGELIDSRIHAAKALTRLSDIRNICETEFLQGRMHRAHELKMAALTYDAEEEYARARLLEAQQHSQRFLPPPSTASPSLPSPPPSPSLPPAQQPAPGITIDDVNEITAQLPEIPEEARKHLGMLLTSLAEEKRR